MAEAKKSPGFSLSTAGKLNLASSVVADVTNIYTTYEAGKSKRESFRHAAAMEAYSQGFRELQVEMDLKRLAETEAAVIGSVRAEAGGSGFATDEGSNADLVSSIHRNVALDAAAIRIGGSAAAFGSQYRAGQFQLQGAQAQTAASLGIASTVISSASKYSKMFAKSESKSET